MTVIAFINLNMLGDTQMLLICAVDPAWSCNVQLQPYVLKVQAIVMKTSDGGDIIFLYQR